MRANSSSNTPHLTDLPFSQEQRAIESLILQLCSYAVELNAFREDFARIQGFFRQGEVWPDQCEYALQFYKMLEKPIRGLNQMIEANPGFSGQVLFNRYDVLGKSCNVESTILEIISRLEAYTEICRDDSEERDREHSEITDDIEHLSDEYVSLIDMLEQIFSHVPALGVQL